MLHRNIYPVVARCAAALVLVGGAGAAHAAAWQQRTVAGMTVQVYRPDGAPYHAAGRGLMIGLHGCTQQATALRDAGNWTAAAERFGVVIALPQVPNGGVVAGCWDYYGVNHTRSTRHEGPVLALVDALVGDAALGVDRAQVYVAGLSSGASEAMVLGCIAPDVFAGVGINAGPTVGTEVSEIAQVASSEQEGTDVCRRLAAANAAHFATQNASVIYGTADHLVAQGYSRNNALVLRGLLGAPTEGALDVTTLPGFMPRGTGATWSDARGVRVMLIGVEGMGHAFPAGTGDGPEINFIATRGVAWPMVMLEQLVVNNRRVTGGPPPTDGGTAGSDAASSTADAGASRADASSTRADASSATRADASSAGRADASARADGGPMGADPQLSGGCASAPGTPLGTLLVALTAWTARARRRRAARG